MNAIPNFVGKCLGYPILVLAFVLAYANMILVHVGAWLIGAEVIVTED